MRGTTNLGSRLAFIAAVMCSVSADAQTPAAPDPEPLVWTTEQDHADMLRQLGITALRPGPSGRPDAENPANYDETLANPYPNWPDLLRLDNGTAVTTAETWWLERRPQLVAAFEREILGHVPAAVPGVEWSVTETLAGDLGGTSVIGRSLIGALDNSNYPAIDVNIAMTLVVPRQSDAPIPVMVMFRAGSLRRALGLEPAARPPGARDDDDPPATEQLIAAGWGFALLDPVSAQADDGAGLTRGIIGLVNKGQARKPDDWGTLRAWAWAAARALDYFETDPLIDASRVGIEGVSRYGKAALVTMAFEPRFAVGLIGSSGEGGVSPYRRNFGEMVENLTGAGEYHWMAGNFLRYGAAEAAFGSADADDLPIDSHSLIALAAPRPVFVSYGVPERGDALWLDQRGSYMATVAAGAAYRLLGASDLGTGEHYRDAQMPEVNEGLLAGTLAWRQHAGGHTDAPNWRYFIPWANRELGLTAAADPAPWQTTVPRRRTDVNSETAHAQLLEKRSAGVIDAYFLGDSITRRWGALDYPELLEHWNETFRGWNAANFAWGGDRTQNMLWRLRNGELDGVSPHVFVIQAGTNNLGDYADTDTRIEAVTAGIRAIVEACLAHSPEAAVVLTGVFPRSDMPRETSGIDEINARLASYAQQRGIRFVDINRELYDDAGGLDATMTTDGLHLSLAGYRTWATALQPQLAEILGRRANTDAAPAPTGNPAALR